MRENRPSGSEGGEQRYCSPTPIDKKERQTRRMPGSRPSSGRRDRAFLVYPEQQCASARTTPFARLILLFAAPPRRRAPVLSQNVWHRSNQCATQTQDE